MDFTALERDIPDKLLVSIIETSKIELLGGLQIPIIWVQHCKCRTAFVRKYEKFNLI